MTVELTTGGDFTALINLTKDGVAFDIPLGTQVEAALLTYDRSELISTIVLSDSGAAGSDWSASTIVVDIGSVETTDFLTYGKVWLQIMVNDTKKLAFFTNVIINKGLL